MSLFNVGVSPVWVLLVKRGPSFCSGNERAADPWKSARLPGPRVADARNAVDDGDGEPCGGWGRDVPGKAGGQETRSATCHRIDGGRRRQKVSHTAAVHAVPGPRRGCTSKRLSLGARREDELDVAAKVGGGLTQP